MKVASSTWWTKDYAFDMEVANGVKLQAAPVERNIKADAGSTSRGFCWSHGGGTKCKNDNCEKIAISNGLCWAHGGGKRCAVEGCRRQAYERTDNLCNNHYQERQHGTMVVEGGETREDDVADDEEKPAAPPTDQ
ncbi:Hypothetical protein PHPALM_17874 [Phytophthora palmivora]|uniref:WRKY19-like zinc finger domain-containing protein n=1 Tax=Phytophthora palmivora TaxID=4796 RepID=A0A2P4XLB8_9STRA|nr:Hypothetical protein PHPALM_17874 [Phytophthora palmivora]